MFSQHFRTVLLLRNSAKITTFMAPVFLPFMTTFLMQNMVVAKDVRLKTVSCAVCLETRSFTIQAFTGILLPYTLSITSCIMAAKSFTTFPIPPYTQLTDHAKLIAKISRPLSLNVAGLLVINAIAAVVVTFKQFEAADMVNKVMMSKPLFKS